jgi:hypothetical protein
VCSSGTRELILTKGLSPVPYLCHVAMRQRATDAHKEADTGLFPPSSKVLRCHRPCLFVPHMRSGKPNGCFDTLTAGTAKEHFIQPSAGKSAQPGCKFTRHIRNMTLQHRRTVPFELIFDSCDNLGVVVAGIMNAISGKKIQNLPSIRRMEFCSPAVFVFNIHLQQVEQSYPLRIYVAGVRGTAGCGRYALGHFTSISNMRSRCTIRAVNDHKLYDAASVSWGCRELLKY